MRMFAYAWIYTLGDFTAKLLNGVKYTIALVMRLDSDEDDFLAEMKKYLDENRSVRANAFSASALAGKRKWWTSNELVSELQRKSQVFSRFSQLEEKRKEQGFDSSLQFLTIEMKLGEGETPRYNCFPYCVCSSVCLVSEVQLFTVLCLFVCLL